MTNSTKTCPNCSNTFWDDTFASVGHTACTNCLHERKVNKRSIKGVYISTCTTKFGDTYFLTPNGWVNMIGIDTKKNKITYARNTANVRFLLANLPYGGVEVETKFSAF